MACTRILWLVLMWSQACIVFSQMNAEAVQGEDPPPRTNDGCLERCGLGGDVTCISSGLERIPNSTVCPRASVLDLTNNHINILRRGDFAGFVDLESLLLNDNEIRDIFSGAFEGLENLMRLYLRSNNLTRLRPGVFEGLHGLTDRLILTTNQITNITTGVFGTLTFLRALSVDANHITSIQAGSFDGMSSLTYLDLKKNRIVQIVNGTFSGLGQLKTLDLSKNRIENLESGAFDGLTNLRELKLNYNRLTTVAAIVRLPYLNTLEIADNQIESIGDNRFLEQRLTQSFSIAVEKNPLRCNCSTEPLRRWYRDHQKRADQASCETPAKYSGQRLVEIEEPIRCQSDDSVDETNWHGEGNLYSITDNQESLVSIIAIIVVAGAIILGVSALIVIRRHMRKARRWDQDVEHQTPPPAPDLRPNRNFVEGYSTFLTDEPEPTRSNGEVVRQPPNIANHTFKDMEQDESSRFLAPERGYLSVDEINSRPSSREPSKRSHGRSGRALITSTPKSKASAPGSLTPDPVCEIDLTSEGEMTISPGPMFDGDESFDFSENEPKEIQYATLNHNKSSRNFKPSNHSRGYIAPRDLEFRKPKTPEV